MYPTASASQQRDDDENPAPPKRMFLFRPSIDPTSPEVSGIK